MMTEPITGSSLRERFLEYFTARDHFRAKSAPLVPQGDDTLLFNNAGMVQFKDVFTGKETRPYTRATSSQKCVRAGGKHNDLENVGRTARHHTFFEMLGNFSFGDYFKEEACKFAWEFLTKELGMDESRLTVTVFGGEDGLPPDEEAEKIWHEVVGVPMDRISRHGAKDNFWAMGDTGPCGPCSEIHYDRGEVEGAFGGDDPEGDRVLEVWNLVFMQYDRDSSGKLTPLPAPCVDTGMGLERLAMVLGGFASNYDTDLLRPLIAYSEEKMGKKYTSTDGQDDVAMRVIADHARATAFLIADGVLPSNEGRGYVLRAIMRRAVLFGDLSGLKDPFFQGACARVVDVFADAYPELVEAKDLIARAAATEEEAFRKTLSRGLALFDEVAKPLKKGDVISGDDVFLLHDTHGFPSVMTELMAHDRGLSIDMSRYEELRDQARDTSRGDLGVAGTGDAHKALASEHGPTTFLGYDTQTGTGKVIALLKDGEPTGELKEGDDGELLLDQTPFYGESGGQMGDAGTLEGKGASLAVTDTKKALDLHLHLVHVVSGSVKVGDELNAHVDAERLAHITRNHSATHLVHKALRDVLGAHVAQKGSLVSPEKLRFDFSHFEAMTPDQVVEVEDRVNAAILANDVRTAEVMPFDKAKESGAVALFGEKYGDEVRVITLGESIEFCGGIHVRATGDIGMFKITSEGPLAAGVRRVEAVSGLGALAWAREKAALLSEAAHELKVGDSDVPERVARLKTDLKTAERELERARQKAATESAGRAASSAREVNGIKVLTERVEGIEAKGLREYADKLRDKLGSGVVVLGLPLADDKCTLLVALTKDLVGKLHAGGLPRGGHRRPRRRQARPRPGGRKPARQARRRVRARL